MNNFIDIWAPPVVKYAGWLFLVLGMVAVVSGDIASVFRCAFGLAVCGWYRLDMLINDLYIREPIEEESE